MAKILLAWELGSGLGHCAKLAPVAAGLIERRHQVFFAARDIVTARYVGRDLPITYLPAPHLMGKTDSPIAETFTFAHILHNAGFGNDEQLFALVDNWRNLLKLVQPDAILCEHAPTALIAGRIENLRRFVMGTGFSLPPDVHPLPDLRLRPTSNIDGLQKHENDLVERVNRVLSAAGCEAIDRLSQPYTDVSGRFLMTFQELDHHGPRDAETYRGTWSLDGGEPPPPWPAGSGPKVFAYLKGGTPALRIDRAIAALQALPARTLAYIPGAKAADIPGSSLRLCDRPVDLSAIASECDLAILNGTAGATTQFLLAGVPLLLTPLFFEQAVLSVRVADLGAGMVLNPRHLEKLRMPLEQILNSSRHREAAARFAKRYDGFTPNNSRDCVVSELSNALG